MRLLYFSPRDCWPLTTGARIRDYQLAKHLAERAQVHYAGLCPEEATASPAPAECGFPQSLLSRDKAYSAGNLLRGLAGPLPVTVLNYTSGRIKDQIAQLLEKENFDSAQIEGVHLVEYVAVIRKVSPRTRIVADWHNIESEIMWRYAETASSPLRKLMARRTAPLIERAENRLLRICDAHTVVSGRDREKLLLRCPDASISLVPNGVDVAYYSSGIPHENPREILFVGSMDYHANAEAVTWFVSNVWPIVKRSAPDLTFRIVGRDPVPEVKALASPDVLVTGTVDDIRPFYARAAATVVPLRVGGGTRLKILESMAARVPVVSTRLGAEGIDVTGDSDILLADTSAELAAAVEKIVTDRALAERLKLAGYALANRLYDWSIAGEQLYSVHARLLADGN
ncbi:MAG TPA: glycosyltransferase [Bryobacteraceae bacterium]|jgi:glycosyltransferase involved in cell wall biosynthesis|nr:glycosyltransferase [Bryobacteraceae bacterium]